MLITKVMLTKTRDYWEENS